MTTRATRKLAVCAAALLVSLTVRATDTPEAAIERQEFARAAELLRERLSEAPGDEPTRFLLARVLGWNGDYAASLAQYRALLDDSPGNVDYSLGRARVLAWDGRDEAALAELQRARSLAPEYEAVWQLELALLARHPGSAARLRALRRRAAQRFPAAEWWHEPASTEPAARARPKTELTVAAVHQSLSRPVPDWSTLTLQLTRQGGGDTFHAALQREERFGRSDVTVSGGGGWTLSERWSAGADLGVGFDAGFLPELSIGAWAGRSWPSGWEGRLRVRQRRYAEDEVTSAAITAGRYFGRFRLAYTFDRSRLHGEASASTRSATLNYFHSDTTRVNVTIADGQEVEASAPGRVLRTDVSGMSAGMQHELGGRWRLSWWLGAHRQGDLYRRRYAGVSVAAGL